jgi:hypothetical protein
MSHPVQLAKKILDDVDALIKEVEKDKEVSEAEATALIDLEQQIADKFSALFDKYGVVIGDERID